MADELSTAQRIEHVIRAYVKALNSADADEIAACFCQGADHYFPAQPKRTGAAALGAHFANIVRQRQLSWTVDQILVDVDRCAAALEWTLFEPKATRYLIRGVDWFVFDPGTIQFREVRTYVATPDNQDRPRQELRDFDYEGRGYPTQAPIE
jgi:hypothetical protein